MFCSPTDAHTQPGEGAQGSAAAPQGLALAAPPRGLPSLGAHTSLVLEQEGGKQMGTGPQN